MKRQKGFTLIELLVVIAIIGILAAIVLVSLGDARQSARDTQRIGDLRGLTSAVEVYFDQNGNYPTQTGCNNTAFEGAIGDVGTSIPTDPLHEDAGPHQYRYDSDDLGTGRTIAYVLNATLEQDDHSALDDDFDDPDNLFACDCASSSDDASAEYCLSSGQ